MSEEVAMAMASAGSASRYYGGGGDNPNAARQRIPRMPNESAEHYFQRVEAQLAMQLQQGYSITGSPALAHDPYGRPLSVNYYVLSASGPRAPLPVPVSPENIQETTERLQHMNGGDAPVLRATALDGAYQWNAENNAFYGTVMDDGNGKQKRAKDEDADSYGSAVYLPRALSPTSTTSPLGTPARQPSEATQAGAEQRGLSHPPPTQAHVHKQ